MQGVQERGDKEMGTEEKFQKNPCLICGSKEVDKCHIKTKKVSQVNDAWNLLSMCRKHHTEQHQGWKNFLEKYPIVRWALEARGWEIQEYCGKLLMHHPKWREINERMRRQNK